MVDCAFLQSCHYFLFSNKDGIILLHLSLLLHISVSVSSLSLCFFFLIHMWAGYRYFRIVIDIFWSGLKGCEKGLWHDCVNGCIFWMVSMTRFVYVFYCVCE